MVESKSIENKRVHELHQEQEGTPFNKGSFAASNASFGNLARSQTPPNVGDMSGNAHSTTSFRTLKSRVQLEEVLPSSPIGSKSYNGAQEKSFYVESDEDISKDVSTEHSSGAFSDAEHDSNAVEYQSDEMDLFRDTRKGYFEALFQANKQVKRPNALLTAAEKEQIKRNHLIQSNIENEWFSFASSKTKYQVTEPIDLSFTKKQILLIKKNWIKMIKFSLAYFIAMLLCVIPACRRWFGHTSADRNLIWFLPLAVILHHPVHYSSIQIEITLQAFFGGLLSIAWSMLGLFVATCDLRLINHTFGVGALLWLSLFVSTLFSYWLSNRFRRLMYISQTFTIGAIYFHLINVKEQLFAVSNSTLLTSSLKKHWGDVIWAFAIPYLFGLIISLVISLVIFPEYNNTLLLKSYNRMMKQMVFFLDGIMDESVDLKESRDKLIRINNFEFLEEYWQHRCVFKITSFTNEQMKVIRDDLVGLMTLLRSMPTEGAKGCFSEKSDISETFGSSLEEIIQTTSSLMQMNFKILNEKVKPTAEFLEEQEALTSSLNTTVKNIDTLYDCYQLPDNGKDLSLKTVDALLFIKSIKTTAKNVSALSIDLNEIAKNSGSKTLQRPNVSLSAALTTLAAQCKLDQGFGDECDTYYVSNETTSVINEIYNTYTAKHASKSSSNDGMGLKIRPSMAATLDRNKFIDDEGFVRAANLRDFRSKTATAEWRYKLWLLKQTVINECLWYAFEVAFTFTFILLPGWLPVSHKWFSKYQIWAGCVLFHVVNNRNNVGGFETLFLRVLTCLISCFFGWVAIMMKPFSSPYIIMFIGGLFALITSHIYLNHHFTKNGTIALISFTVIVSQPWSTVHETTANVWKHTWTTSLSLIVGAFLSVLINWILASKSTYTRINDSMSNLIAHLGNDYQLIVDRFLYKDSRDATTILDNEYSNVLEIKLTKEIIRIENLIRRSFIEHKRLFQKSIDRIGYLKLLESCKAILENLIQARQEVQFFDVFNADLDEGMTMFLMSFRSASVSSCCYNFAAVSNCFKSASALPAYLPNTILARKQLYDKMAHYENNADQHVCEEKRSTISNEELIHGMAFSQAFTNFSINLENMISQSKSLLGEDMNM